MRAYTSTYCATSLHITCIYNLYECSTWCFLVELLKLLYEFTYPAYLAVHTYELVPPV